MTFWSKMSSSSHIDTLLSSEDVTLQVLMDEDDIFQECKVKNKKLIEFLVRPEILEELVTYITTEPPEDLDDAVRFKYSNIACELLTSDIVAINETLASDKVLLEKLYSFLHTDKQLNPLLASYFSRTLQILVVMRGEMNWFSCQFTCLKVLEFFKSKEDFLSLLMNHLGTSAIKDLLYRLMTCIEGREVRSNVLDWLSEQKLVCHLVNLIHPSVDEERHSNAADVLCNMIAFFRDKMVHPQEPTIDPGPLLTAIESPEVISELLNQMFSGEKMESVLVSGMSVLMSLLDIRRHGSTDIMVTHSQEKISEDVEEKLISSLITIVNSILSSLKDFKELLLYPPTKSSFMTTVGCCSPPLGMTRLCVAKLVASLLGTGIPAVGQAIIEQDIMTCLFSLFKEYEWNNFLHTEVEKCLECILTWQPVVREHESSDGNGDGIIEASNPLLHYILHEFNIIKVMVELWQESKDREEATGQWKGHMGHVVKMVQSIMNHCVSGENCDHIYLFIKDDLSEELGEQWKDVCRQTDDIVKLTYSISGDDALSEREPKFKVTAQYSSDGSLQQVFNEFQIQQMSKDYIDGIGFKDKEFNEPEEKTPWKPFSTPFIVQDDSYQLGELFEQTCKDRDISCGDIDDMWDEKNMTFDTKSKSSHMRKDSLENDCSVKGWDDTEYIEDHDQEEEEEDEDTPWSHKISPDRAEAVTNWANFTNFNIQYGKGQGEGENWADFTAADQSPSGVKDQSDELSGADAPQSVPQDITEKNEMQVDDKGDNSDDMAVSDSGGSCHGNNNFHKSLEQDELMDNYLFLSSSGLIKQKEPDCQENGPVAISEQQDADSNVCDNDKITFNSMESTQQNGPI